MSRHARSPQTSHKMNVSPVRAQFPLSLHSGFGLTCRLSQKPCVSRQAKLQQTSLNLNVPPVRALSSLYSHSRSGLNHRMSLKPRVSHHLRIQRQILYLDVPPHSISTASTSGVGSEAPIPFTYAHDPTPMVQLTTD